jgi:hypothetical protein
MEFPRDLHATFARFSESTRVTLIRAPVRPQRGPTPGGVRGRAG